MATAQKLFNDDELPERPTTQSLVVRPRPGQKLNKEQKKFNRLIARVEKLREQLDRERQRLDSALVFHSAEIRPRLVRVASARHALVRALQPFLSRPELKRGDRKEVETILVQQIDEILRIGEPIDDDLRALFERLHGASLATLEGEQMDEVRSELETMFASMGVDLDLSAFKPGMSEAEMAAAAARMSDEIRQQAQAAEHAPRARRTSKHLERERHAEALRKASLGGIFRQLAKLLHPDLEPDPGARGRKEVLMQEVTAAYARQDMHTLLRLQLEWLHREDADVARMTDEALRGFNSVLEEQAKELEFEIDAMYVSPKYEPLMDDIGEFGGRILRDVRAQAGELDALLTQLEIAVSRLRAPDALVEVKQVIQERRRARRQASHGRWVRE